jgi:hypothetical protein
VRAATAIWGLVTLVCLAAAFGPAADGGQLRAASGPGTLVYWSPFTAAGTIKPSLSVRAIAGSSSPANKCIAGSDTIGVAGYRCFAGNGVYDPCWRDGPGATQEVVCALDPWTESLVRFAVPNLLYADGVPWGPLVTGPRAAWGIVLADGTRCSVLDGARDSVGAPGKSSVVSYSCGGGLYLLDLPKLEDGVLKMGSARYIGGKYTLLGDVAVAQAILGGLPPPLAFQEKQATAAMRAAPAILRSLNPAQATSVRHSDPVLVRLSVPDGRWAFVQFQALAANNSVVTFQAMLHDVSGRWQPVAASDCGRVPKPVQLQLLGPGGGNRC